MSTSRALSYAGGATGFVDDGQTLAYQCGNAVKLSNVGTGAESFLGGGGYGVSAVGTSAGLVAYAECGVSPSVAVFSFPQLKPLATLEGVAELDVDAVAISRHGEHIVVCAAGPDNTVSVYGGGGGPSWGEATKLCSAPCKDGCMAASVNPGDASEICTISSAGAVSLRRVLPGAEAHTLESWCPLPDALASEEAVSHGWTASHKLIVGFASGVAVSLDLEDLDVGAAAPVTTLCSASEMGAATAVSATATRVVVGFADGSMTWVDESGSAAPVTQAVCDGAVVSITLGTGGSLWVGSEAGSLSSVTLTEQPEADGGQMAAQIEVAFNHNSQPLISLGSLTWEGQTSLVSCSPAGTVSTWGADKIGSIDTGAEALSMSVTSATGLAAVGSATGVIRLIDLANASQPQTVYRSKVHQGGVTQIEFSPDGLLLASAGEDSKVFFTDAAGSKGFASLGYVPTDAAITSMVWRKGTPDDGDDSDGLRLVVCTASGMLLQLTPPDMDFLSPADLKMTDKDVDKRAWRLRGKFTRNPPVAFDV